MVYDADIMWSQFNSFCDNTKNVSSVPKVGFAKRLYLSFLFQPDHKTLNAFSHNLTLTTQIYRHAQVLPVWVLARVIWLTCWNMGSQAFAWFLIEVTEIAWNLSEHDYHIYIYVCVYVCMCTRCELMLKIWWRLSKYWVCHVHIILLCWSKKPHKETDGAKRAIIRIGRFHVKENVGSMLLPGLGWFDVNRHVIGLSLQILYLLCFTGTAKLCAKKLSLPSL